MRVTLALLLLAGCTADPVTETNDAATNDVTAADAAAVADTAANTDVAPRSDTVDRDAPTVTTDVRSAELVLESSAFMADGTLPVDHTCDGAGRSPPLAWRGAPAETVSFALMMSVVARDGMKWNWVLYDIPGTVSALPEASMGIGTAGLTSDGPNLAYSPPCSRGPGAMRYTFTLYALSARPMLPASPRMVTGAVLTAAIERLTIARASISVTYTR